MTKLLWRTLSWCAGAALSVIGAGILIGIGGQLAPGVFTRITGGWLVHVTTSLCYVAAWWGVRWLGRTRGVTLERNAIEMRPVPTVVAAMLTLVTVLWLLPILAPRVPVAGGLPTPLGSADPLHPALAGLILAGGAFVLFGLIGHAMVWFLAATLSTVDRLKGNPTR